jgi:hypothetical protein
LADAAPALAFTLHGKVQLGEGGATATHAASDFDGWQSAVAGAVMTEGVHYAEVTWLQGGRGQELLAGVVGPGFDPTPPAGEGGGAAAAAEGRAPPAPPLAPRVPRVCRRRKDDPQGSLGSAGASCSELVALAGDYGEDCAFDISAVVLKGGRCCRGFPSPTSLRKHCPRACCAADHEDEDEDEDEDEEGPEAEAAAAPAVPAAAAAAGSRGTAVPARAHAEGWMYDASSFGAAKARGGRLYSAERKSDWPGQSGRSQRGGRVVRTHPLACSIRESRLISESPYKVYHGASE